MCGILNTPEEGIDTSLFFIYACASGPTGVPLICYKGDIGAKGPRPMVVEGKMEQIGLRF